MFSLGYAADRPLRSIAQLLVLQNSAPFLWKTPWNPSFRFASIPSRSFVRLCFRIICLNSSLPNCSVSSSVKISNMSFFDQWFTLLVRGRFGLILLVSLQQNVWSPSRSYTFYCVRWDTQKRWPPQTVSGSPVFVQPTKNMKCATLKWATHTSGRWWSQVWSEAIFLLGVGSVSLTT